MNACFGNDSVCYLQNRCTNVLKDATPEQQAVLMTNLGALTFNEVLNAVDKLELEAARPLSDKTKVFAEVNGAVT